jgi:hypothetical protein
MARIIGLTGKNVQRLFDVADGLLLDGEIHSVSDFRRLFINVDGSDSVIGPKWLGKVESEAEMLALFTSNSNGCFDGDRCYRNDTKSVWECISSNGEAIADWIPHAVSDDEVFLDGGDFTADPEDTVEGGDFESDPDDTIIGGNCVDTLSGGNF